ncbi:hypothetical protein MMC26_002251 [Xylographa opegraphella]|nr:hypothetical protein [Xylographa opegraphella]
MEQELLPVLAATQSHDAPTRLAAEQQLKALYSDQAFPGALVTIGAHPDVALPERIIALVVLKQLVGIGWSPALEEFGDEVLLGDDVKADLKNRLLAIVFDGNVDSKVINQTAVIVSKIARAEFPEEWPDLLDLLLSQQSTANDTVTEAILIVLGELIQDGLDEDQFYTSANDLVKFFHDVAADGSKKLLVRAHAIGVFRMCFDSVETLKDKEEVGIRHFVRGICDAWSTFFRDVINERMPTLPTTEQENEAENEVATTWRGVVALKIQVLAALVRIQYIYPDILPTQELFSACWAALQAHGGAYYACFVDGDKQGNLVTANGLPYTFDLLVIEELDFLQTLLDAPAVRVQLDRMTNDELQGKGDATSQWVMEVVGSLVNFSAITSESEGLWDIDFNVFLSEETFAETNNTPRSSCSAFVWRMSALLPIQTLKSIVEYMKLIWADANPSWRHKEAALFQLQQILDEYKAESRPLDANALGPCVEYIASTMNEVGHYLRARGHIVMSSVMASSMAGSGGNRDMVLGYARQSLKALDEDDSEIVKTSCIRIMSAYLLILPDAAAIEMQMAVVDGIAKFLDTQDMEDMDDNVDLVDTVLQTLRDTIMASPTTCLEHNGFDVMLALVKLGGARDESTYILVEEAFECAAQAMVKSGTESYAQLCYKIMPALVANLDAKPDDDHEKATALLDVSMNLIKLLAVNAIEPVPEGFISEAMPRLCRVILSDGDFYLLQQATLVIKEILCNDPATVFAWVDPEFQKTGLEMLLLVVAHLLSPQVDDASAAEVGELAVEVVEKAGPELLGNSMRDLLKVCAVRLCSAEHVTLVQSLVKVFARLSLLNTSDVLNFLAELPIGETTGLVVVTKKWLENSTHFVGFEAIRQNIMALVAIYSAHDPRFDTIQVNGDMIVDRTASRIKTRSMAKKDPIKYTIVSADLKIIKLLINELVPAYDTVPSSHSLLHSKHCSGGSVDSWSTDSSGLGPQKADDETQKYLVEFFANAGMDPHFQRLYLLLTPLEQTRLVEMVDGHQRMMATQAARGH